MNASVSFVILEVADWIKNVLISNFFNPSHSWQDNSTKSFLKKFLSRSYFFINILLFLSLLHLLYLNILLTFLVLLYISFHLLKLVVYILFLNYFIQCYLLAIIYLFFLDHFHYVFCFIP